jgi:hypothetical protein
VPLLFLQDRHDGRGYLGGAGNRADFQPQKEEEQGAGRFPGKCWRIQEVTFVKVNVERKKKETNAHAHAQANLSILSLSSERIRSAQQLA